MVNGETAVNFTPKGARSLNGNTVRIATSGSSERLPGAPSEEALHHPTRNCAELPPTEVLEGLRASRIHARCPVDVPGIDPVPTDYLSDHFLAIDPRNVMLVIRCLNAFHHEVLKCRHAGKPAIKGEDCRSETSVDVPSERFWRARGTVKHRMLTSIDT